MGCADRQLCRCADHLLGVTGIDPEPDVRLDRGVELRDRSVLRQGDRGRGVQTALAVARHGRLDLLGGLDVLLSALLRHYSTISKPIERAVPSIIFMACSASWALRSLPLASSIGPIACRRTRP